MALMRSCRWNRKKAVVNLSFQSGLLGKQGSKQERKDKAHEDGCHKNDGGKINRHPHHRDQGDGKSFLKDAHSYDTQHHGHQCCEIYFF